MKKLLSIIICTAILLSFSANVWAWTPQSTDYTPIERGDDVIARIVLGSDTHIGYDGAADKLRNAYASINKLGGADALIIAGDITDNGLTEEYSELMSIISANSEKLTVDLPSFKGSASGTSVGTTIALLGNHEFLAEGVDVEERFREMTGQEPDGLYWIAGKVPVIKLSMTTHDSTATYASKLAFLQSSLNSIDSKDYTGHIFLVTHIPVKNTVVGSVFEDPFGTEIKELLSKYPQIIHYSGHSHENPYNPNFIDQSAGYTSITGGTIGKYFDSCEYTEEKLGSTAVIFDVKSDGTTEFYRVDFENGRIIYENEEWVLDSKDTAEDFIYFAGLSKGYAGANSRPAFPEDSLITAVGGSTPTSLVISFTRAVPATEKNYDYVDHYTIVLKSKTEGAQNVTVDVVNDLYYPTAGEKFTAVVEGLTPYADYSVTVSAHNTYSKASRPITSKKTFTAGNPFTDVSREDWYFDTVIYAASNGLMNGTGGSLFSPTTNTSRAMIVQLLYNMEGRPEVTYKPIFTDVKEDAWYADAVIWAYENGVTTGSSATTFSPDALVTREQVAVFLYRYMKDYKGEEMEEGADLSAFPDAGKISPYAGFAEAVSWANGVGIITGKSAGGNVTLAPLDSAQRCETATMFARFHRSFVV